MRIFISSPGGLEVERAIIVSEIAALSDQEVQKGNPAISISRWPDDIAAGIAEYGQSVINRQTVDLEILVCLIGTRMGSPTPRANSGTEEEFDRVIEAVLNGEQVQVLLFFSNLPVRSMGLDPNQLLLVRAFREKASRLGVLYHTFNDHHQLCSLFHNSLREAYDTARGKGHGRFQPKPKRAALAFPFTTLELGNIIFKNRETAPQRADSRIVPLVEYRGQNITVRGIFSTSSRYFRFGFKYYDAREQLFGPGSIQTLGQNIVIHIGRNTDNPIWFLTAYRGSYRVGQDRPIDGTFDWNEAQFAFEISSSDTVAVLLNGQRVYEMFFVLDGMPCLALLGWSDEHEFLCELRDVKLNVHPRGTVAP